ncbi:MAG TPA: CHAT domain-containing tetratricopeptide repeat protein [Terriglobales bacterium]|nr:CHAT domain-containing tetratricopeptide repeat protein [Terriglobales bacterium]
MNAHCRAVIVIALVLVTGVFSSSETTPRASLDEKIQQADKLQDQGAIEASRQLYESLLPGLREGDPSRQLGHVLNGLSNVAASEGNYRVAVDFAQQAEGVYRELGDSERESYAINSRGIAQGELGLYPAAQASFRQALALSQSVGDFETQVRTLNNLGNVYYFPGNYLEALHAYQDAWNILGLRTANKDKWNDYWRQITQVNEATLYQRLGRYQSALEIYKKVELSPKGLSASDRAQILTNLGVVYRRLGDPYKALDSYQSALTLYSEQHDSGGEINVLKNIGIVYALDQNNPEKAEEFFERSLARARATQNHREEMQAHLYLGETLFRKKDFQKGVEEFQEALTQARKLGTTEDQWKALYGIGRAEESLAQPAQAEAEYREAISTIEASRVQLQLSALRAEFLADKRDVYDALISLLLKKNDVKESFAFLERSRARTFQDRLASDSFSEVVKPAVPTLDEAQKYLDSSTILMEFWVSGDRIALIWCTRDSFGMQQTQLSSEERAAAMSFLRGMPDNLQGNWRSQAAILSRLIPNDLSMPSNMKHLLIVPDGWLSSVPFDLVPIPGNPRALSIERYDISYLPTAALLRRSRDRVTRFPWMPELAAFGNPVFETDTKIAGSLAGANGLMALPFSSEEIQSVAKMTSGKAESFLGAQDLKSAFLSDKARSSPILHVSTHAFADADVPEDSRILFSSDAGSKEPDYVFLRELYDMDLRGVDLATLSACDTERGKMIRGEGVQAFSRALLFAGSRSSLTTLWRVDDQPTSEFVKQFYYFALEKHQSKAEALRSAKLKFLRSGTMLRNPAHWAAFVLNGDGFDPLPRFISWAELVASSALIVLFLSLGIWLSLRFRRRVDRVHRS